MNFTLRCLHADKRLTESAKSIGRILFDEPWKGPECYLSRDEIARRSGRSPSTVYRGLVQLAEAGYIARGKYDREIVRLDGPVTAPEPARSTWAKFVSGDTNPVRTDHIPPLTPKVEKLSVLTPIRSELTTHSPLPLNTNTGAGLLRSDGGPGTRSKPTPADTPPVPAPAPPESDDGTEPEEPGEVDRLKAEWKALDDKSKEPISPDKKGKPATRGLTSQELVRKCDITDRLGKLGFLPNGDPKPIHVRRPIKPAPALVASPTAIPTIPDPAKAPDVPVVISTAAPSTSDSAIECAALLAALETPGKIEGEARALAASRVVELLRFRLGDLDPTWRYTWNAFEAQLIAGTVPYKKAEDAVKEILRGAQAGTIPKPGAAFLGRFRATRNRPEGGRPR